MKQIDLTRIAFSFDATEKIITVSERDVNFDTTYNVVGKNESRVFEFDHSTGPEFDPNTIYIYKDKSGYTLQVANDARITEQAAKMYLNRKLKK